MRSATLSNRQDVTNGRASDCREFPRPGTDVTMAWQRAYNELRSLFTSVTLGVGCPVGCATSCAETVRR
jgi:hypothetical protein